MVEILRNCWVPHRRYKCKECCSHLKGAQSNVNTSCARYREPWAHRERTFPEDEQGLASKKRQAWRKNLGREKSSASNSAAHWWSWVPEDKDNCSIHRRCVWNTFSQKCEGWSYLDVAFGGFDLLWESRMKDRVSPLRFWGSKPRDPNQQMVGN